MLTSKQWSNFGSKLTKKVRQDLYPENIDNQFGGFKCYVFQHVADIDRFLLTIHWASDQVLISENIHLRFRQDNVSANI